jgi:hypothetical protein
MSAKQLNRIAEVIKEEVADYQLSLEEKMFGPFVGRRVSFKLYDSVTRTSAPTQGTVQHIWTEGEDNNVYIKVTYQSPNSGRMTQEDLYVDNVTFLE